MPAKIPTRAATAAAGALLSAAALVGATAPTVSAATATTATTTATLRASSASASAPTMTVAVTPTCASACFLGVRTGAHPDFDRVVIDLGGPTLPTWQATAGLTSLTYDSASGESRPVPLGGTSFLRIDTHGVTNTTTTGQSSFTGPTLQTLTLPSVKGYALTGGYEGYEGFGLALGTYSSYRVYTLTSPNRLVIDVNH
ncbi:hypothetical protein [Streptomyces sp. NPDC093225]|uniref:AMIN-like domain-containing (lipo)protein n=1 Tax=Streptomyces sp. NPDC093225 TaxID=3366034 RepID=UPI0038109AA8